MSCNIHQENEHYQISSENLACHLEDFSHLLLETQIYVHEGSTFPVKYPSSRNLGGKERYLFTPEVNAAGAFYSKGRLLINIYLCF